MATGNTGAGAAGAGISMAGLISAAGVVAAIASILGFLGSLNWCLDLFSHFRVQYFILLGMTALLLLALRRRSSAAVVAAAAALNLATILPLYFGGSRAPAGKEPVARVMLVNVNTGVGNPRSVADALVRFSPDILVLEEVSARWVNDLQGALQPYAYRREVPRNDNFGIAVYSRFPITWSRTAYFGDAGVPSVVVVIEMPNGRCTLIATHPLPPAGGEQSRSRNVQLAEVARQVRCADGPVLLVGDLNVTPWSPFFRRLQREAGLDDSMKGWGVQASWPTFNPLLRIPIDHCLHSAGIRIARRQLGPDVGSDHFPLIVDFITAGGVTSKGAPE